MNMALTTNRESANEIASSKKFISDVKSKDFTRERTQAIRSNSTNYHLINKNNKFDFTDLKMEKELTYEYHHRGVNKKTMDIINKRDKSPENFGLIEKQQELTEATNLRFKFDSNLNRKVWVPRRPDKRGRDEMAAVNLESLVRNNERNRSGGEHFEFIEPRASKSTKRNRQESTEDVSSNEESEVARPTASFPIVDLKDYDITEKVIHYIQLNHIIHKPKIVNPEAEENLKKAEFNFMVDL